MKIPFLLRSGLIAVAATLIPAGPVRAAVYLGDAQGFNAVIFGDQTVSLVGFGIGDTEGRLAVQGNLTLPVGGYTVGGAAILTATQNPLSTYDSRIDLVVGGNVTVQNGGAVFAQWGGVRIGGEILNGRVDTATNPDSFNTVQRNVANLNPFLNFSATESLIRGYSQTWKDMATTGTVLLDGSILRLTGTSSTLNVFNVTAAQWSGSGFEQHVKVPEGSTVLINISGTSISNTNGGMQYLDASGAVIPDRYTNYGLLPYRLNTIVNAFEATEIESTGYVFEGALFAPDALWTAQGSAVNGQAFLGSVYKSGGTEFHNFFLDADDIVVIPEMGTLFLALIPLGLVLGLRFRRRRV